MPRRGLPPPPLPCPKRCRFRQAHCTLPRGACQLDGTDRTGPTHLNRGTCPEPAAYSKQSIWHRLTPLAMPEPLSLRAAFADLPDPRVERTRWHSLLDLLVIALCATLCGADSFNDIEAWAHAKEAWLRERLELSHGIPSHDTFNRVFARLDPDAFTTGFLRWVEALREPG